MPYITSEKTNIFQKSLEYNLPLSKSNLLGRAILKRY